MGKLHMCFFLAIACNQAMVMSLRQKRQSNSAGLENRFAWNVPVGTLGTNSNQVQPNRPGQEQLPGQREQFPGQGQSRGQFPEQWHFDGEEKFSQQAGQTGQGQEQFVGAMQGQLPDRGQEQFSGQGQWNLPGQGQGQFQWPGQGQGQFQWPGQGQGQFQLPGQGQVQLPGLNQGQLQGQGQQQSTTQAPASTTQSVAIRQCIQSCPVTSEYNPVCGTNNVTYTNPGRLICARECGTNVAQRRQGPCPTTPSG